jgi:RimJ/RimL family protein N-acetyltransferase
VDYLIAPERTEDEGFVLRSYHPGDGALLADALNASYAHLAPWMPWAKPHTTEAEAEERVRVFRARYLLAEDFTLGILSPDGCRLFGGCGYHLREGPHVTRSAELGMWIRASEAGRGLGTRVTRALVAWGFGEWPWLRLSWRCDERNLASVRTAERAGLMREGLLRGQPAEVGDGRRNTVCFAVLRSETSG